MWVEGSRCEERQLKESKKLDIEKDIESEVIWLLLWYEALEPLDDFCKRIKQNSKIEKRQWVVPI